MTGERGLAGEIVAARSTLAAVTAVVFPLAGDLSVIG
jgi:hypothetical protein